MKVKEIKRLGIPFDGSKYPLEDVLDRDDTVEVKLEINEGEEKKVTFGYVNIDDVYNSLKSATVNLNRCYVEDFSLERYRKSHHKSYTIVNINNLTAKHSLFKKVIFSSAQFSGDVNFTGTIFNGKANFYNSHFQDKVNFNDAIFCGNSLFNDVEFSDRTDFTHTKFQSQADFRKSKFTNHIIFDDAIFMGIGFFDEAVFDGETDFNKTNFYSVADFKYTTFNGKTFFYDLQVIEKGDISFFEAIFKKSVTFKDANIVHSSFENTYFTFPANFTAAKFKNTTNSDLINTDFTGAVFKEYGLFKDCEIDKANRETFRIIKHEFVKISNKIDALEFHKKEMEAYSREIKEEKRKNIKDTKNLFGKAYRELKSWPTRIILCLNHWSNNYGTSWIQGIAFTCIVAFVFFYFYTLCLNISLPSMKYYFEFLFIGHKFEFMSEYEPNVFAYFIDAISRIFIGYGYYQIIQPLKKYRMW